MSAIPKKKLCWHCEGSIERNIDNCPFCGVYIHAPEEEATASWNPSFRITSLNEHRASEEDEKDDKEVEVKKTEISQSLHVSNVSLEQLKNEVLPIVFLLMGSGFLLFGLVLFLFSHEGTLTLQWKGENWIYFLLVGGPSLILGWWYLNREE